MGNHCAQGSHAPATLVVQVLRQQLSLGALKANSSIAAPCHRNARQSQPQTHPQDKKSCILDNLKISTRWQLSRSWTTAVLQREHALCTHPNIETQSHEQDAVLMTSCAACCPVLLQSKKTGVLPGPRCMLVSTGASNAGCRGLFLLSCRCERLKPSKGCCCSRS